MNESERRAWLWTARKVAVSAFLGVHLGATLVWVMPACPLRERCFSAARCYILPLGMWQYWGMFAPDPVRDTVTLEAQVIDARGLRYAFAFPKLADYTSWARIPRFRHTKFAGNLATPELQFNRELAARHVVRQLALGDEAFPLNVSLVYKVRTTPAPGAPADPMTPPYPYLLGTFHFTGRDETSR